MRDAQTLTVDKHATLFEHCDAFIDTDTGGWSLILANPKGRAAVDPMIDRAINWDFGTPLQEWWKEAPPDWRAIDINLAKYEADGYAKRVPPIGNASYGAREHDTARMRRNRERSQHPRHHP